MQRKIEFEKDLVELYQQKDFNSHIYSKELNAIKRELNKVWYKLIFGPKDGYIPNLNAVVESFLNKRFKVKFICSNTHFRVKYHKIKNKFHLDNNNAQSPKEIPDFITLFKKDIGMQFPFKLKPGYNTHNMINFWAVLNTVSYFPLGFGPIGILDDQGHEIATIHDSTTKYEILYTPAMSIGDFYIFNSFKKPHGGIFPTKKINDRNSLELRCVYYPR